MLVLVVHSYVLLFFSFSFMLCVYMQCMCPIISTWLLNWLSYVLVYQTVHNNNKYTHTTTCASDLEQKQVFLCSVTFYLHFLTHMFFVVGCLLWFTSILCCCSMLFFFFSFSVSLFPFATWNVAFLFRRIWWFAWVFIFCTTFIYGTNIYE